MNQNNPFDPNRPTKGTCTGCSLPIELYEDVFYGYVDSKEELYHKECLDEHKEEENMFKLGCPICSKPVDEWAEIYFEDRIWHDICYEGDQGLAR